MKNNKIWYILAFLLLAIILAFVFFKNNSTVSNKTSNYNSQKTSSNSSTNSSSLSNTNSQNTNSKSENNKQPSEPPKETQLATFSTKIYSKDNNRQENMKLTASRLNEQIVKNGETFSFCNTLGPSTSDKGYKEADIFDQNGKKKKGLGGGNCQISSTLYNSVLAVPGLTVVERHAHSNYVPYIQKGKDAAVAYGSYDFKFRNDTGKDIKLIFEVTESNVTSTINQIG